MRILHAYILSVENVHSDQNKELPLIMCQNFGLDKAVAFAAGHRPCAECRRERYNSFKSSWQLAHRLDKSPSADDIDLELHPARIDKRRKVTYEAALASLPDGCFVQIQESAYLVSRETLLLWTPDGYARRDSLPRNSTVTVLTPKPIVECLRQGYTPAIHESARLR